MKIVYNSGTNIHFYTGDTIPESISDSRYDNGIIPNGIFYIDTLSHNVYVMSDSTWLLVTDSTEFSSFVPNTAVITASVVNGSGNARTYRANSTFYYTSTFNNLTSIILPRTFDNNGAWFALEDSLGQGFNVCVESRTGLKVIERVGGITGVSTKHYFFCDGNKWYLAKSFLPPTGPTTFAPNYIYVDADNGSNASGVKYDSSKPFKTITQAMFVAVSGDIIYTKAGIYTDYEILMKNGVTAHFEKGAIVQPTANGGSVKIFNPGPAVGVFKITGNGKFLNPLTPATSNIASVECRGSLQVIIDADEISSCLTWGGSMVVNNAKITSELWIRFGSISFNNCVLIDIKTTTYNIDWGTSESIFNNCTFIRNKTVIPWNVNFPSSVVGQGDQELDNFKFGVANGYGGSTRTTVFLNCLFINNVGGNGISFREFNWDDSSDYYNPTLVISGCVFKLSDNTKKCVLADGAGGVPISAGFYFNNNISNAPTGTINNGTLINKLSGTGFQIAPKIKIPSPYLGY